MWHDLIAALGLMLVLEGIMPFATPRSWRDAMRRAAELDDRVLRLVGLGAMLLGLVLIYWARG
ncbi:MAG TPA: DUF2065 domain-containing protein [Gammaproteobacteria bacterium]|nr:DUF2065 domain-containing protein [Gammaproteobacteria bacterium]